MQQWKVLAVWLGVLVSPAGFAGDVYKCSVGGATVFQDAPCANGKKVEVSGSVIGPSAIPGRDIHTLTAREMESRIQQAGANMRRLNDESHRELDALRARYGVKDGKTLLSESNRIQAEYQPRIAHEAAIVKALDDEIRKRCPRGAALNSTQPTCGR